MMPNLTTVLLGRLGRLGKLSLGESRGLLLSARPFSAVVLVLPSLLFLTSLGPGKRAYSKQTLGIWLSLLTANNLKPPDLWQVYMYLNFFEAPA